VTITVLLLGKTYLSSLDKLPSGTFFIFSRAFILKVPFSRPGDSGSFVRTRNTNEVVGLLFAGDNSSSFACHIETVLQFFHVSVSDQL
jgi:hypothetical protein